MKFKITALLSSLTLILNGDDGALRAAGIGGLVMVLLPIMGVIAILFIIATVDRFTKPNALSSRMMNYNGGMLMFLIMVLLSLFQSVNTLMVSLIVLEFVLAFILFLNWKFRGNIPPKEVKK